MTRQPFFAVRVVLRYNDGSSAQRDYVRGEIRMGRDRFAAWALGDMLMLTEAKDIERFDVVEIDFETVRQNRLYHHTTH